jgi:hypothetical protein
MRNLEYLKQWFISSTYAHAKYRIVMIRHGQSGANVKDVLDEWCDFDLTLEGKLRSSN